MTRGHRSALALAVALALMATPVAAQDVRIGVLAFQGSERAVQEFEPTRAQLARSLPDRRVVLLPMDLASLAQAVAEKRLNFVVTNPGQYIDLEARLGVTRLATLETRIAGVPTDTVGSVVLARPGPEPPRTLADLAGRRVAVVSAHAFGGYQTVWRELDDLGLSPADFAATVETGFPMERVIDAVRDGRADAGVVRACLLEEAIAAGRIGAAEFIVVGERPAPDFPCRLSTRLYPDWPFAKTRETPPDLAKAVAASLLAMAPVDGRAWTAPQDYSSVHGLFRQLKIGPYRRLGDVTLAGLLRAYWPWALAALVAIAWWIVHVARVEVLVRRRTTELEREIAERTRAEREARSHREQRDHFSRLGILGEMASNIAHELNQPLAAIANYAGGMARMIDAGNGDPALLREGARGVAGQAERAAAIIQRIRGFVRRREARRENLDPNDIVREAVALFEALAARRGIALSVDLAADLPKVSVDRIEIEQVVLNLLQNAVDATVEAGRTSGVTVRSWRLGVDAAIAVIDHGAGLAPEIEAHLFEPFFTTKPQGLGLGLSICRTIVESHGGRLWATANDGGGVIMQFTLPGLSSEMQT